MARVNSLDEDSILALFEAKREEDNAAFGSKGAVETAVANVAAQGVLIAQNQADIDAAQSSIEALGSLTPHRISLVANTTTVANTTGGVGNITVSRGPSIFSANGSQIICSVSGIFIFTVLFYMPGTTTEREGWINPPQENGHLFAGMLASGASSDRFSVSGNALMYSNEGMTFEQKAGAVINTTFNLRGAFFPSFIDAA